MNIVLNGQKETLDEGISVKDLLIKKNINANTVACELNLKIIKRAQLDHVILKDGDQLEILRMIGGG